MPSPELVRDFVIAGHGDLEKVKAMLAAHPDLLNAAYEWKVDDHESASQAAAHVGNAAVAEYLLSRGAPLDICTAVMLGRRNDVERLLGADPAAIHTTGAHGIPLLAHAALSGDVAMLETLFRRGARAGVSYALQSAIVMGHEPVARWLLENARPDLTWKNFQGKTALAVALERGFEPLARLLREHGATE
ncbi:MAG: ankyrin repeat domain-containing protein [Armatimonadota bacterium]